MPKKILILLGFLFLTILFLNIVSADMCWVEASSADCEGTSGGKVVMSLSGSTNAHGALAGQGTFAPVLCCDFGLGEDIACTIDNKIISLSSSTNAHAEAPDLASPNYNNDVCYDSLKYCSSIDAGFNCAVGEIEVLYISDTINAHIEGAGLGTQNYNSKICCVVEETFLCDLTSAEWQYEEVIEGADTGAIVNGADCGGFEISFEVFRGSTSCDDINGCENPSNVVFEAGSNSVTGTWNANPSHDDGYHFVATVVNNPSETVTSSAPNLLVKEVPPEYCLSKTICSQYETESYCNPDPCEVAEASVPSDVDCSDPNINCECIWENNECKASWGGFYYYCGNNMINPGETCDNGDWGNITGCSNFDVFTGGNLDCYALGTSSECQFDTTLCTGGTPGGYCGDDVINPGETCDDNDWGPIIGCSDFGVFTGGGLICGTDCQFDTSQCTGPGNSEIGTCVYTQFTDDNCDDGFLTFNWTAEFVWAEGIGPEDDVRGLHLNCVDGHREVVCPAQIPLPFFNIYSFVATLIIIALIYTVIIISKKKKIKIKFT